MSTKRRAAGAVRDKIVITGIAGRLGRLLARRLHRDVEGRDHRHRPPRLPGPPARHRARQGRSAQQEGARHFPRRRCKGAHPHGRHARPAHDRRRAPLVERPGHGAPARRLRQLRRAQGRSCSRRRTSTGRAPTTRSSSARTRRSSPASTSPRFATSSRSTCSRRRSSGSSSRARPSSCARCTSWAACTTRPRTICACRGCRRCSASIPMVQVIHELDVVEAIVLRAYDRRARNLQRRRARARCRCRPSCASSSKPTVPIPHPLAHAVLTTLWRGKLTSFPVPELDHIRYVCMVDGTRAREQLGVQAALHPQRDHSRRQQRLIAAARWGARSNGARPQTASGFPDRERADTRCL